MPKKLISIEVESAGYDIIEALAKAVKDVKAAKASGAGVPAEIGAALVDAITVATDLPLIGADLAESEEEFLKGVNIAAYDLADSFK